MANSEIWYIPLAYFEVTEENWKKSENEFITHGLLEVRSLKENLYYHWLLLRHPM
jgi:hypothetical protein